MLAAYVPFHCLLPVSAFLHEEGDRAEGGKHSHNVLAIPSMSRWCWWHAAGQATAASLETVSHVAGRHQLSMLDDEADEAEAGELSNILCQMGANGIQHNAAACHPI